MAEERRRHVAALDLVRVAAMLYIVGFWHLMNYAFVGAPDDHHTEVTTRITVVALAAFTMLSGYLIGVRPPGPGLAGAAAFYRRRLLRIYPPLVLALIGFVALGLTDWATALRSMLVVGAIVGEPTPTLWYVTMLALFYAATPLLVAGTPGRRVAAAFMVMIVLLALTVWQGLQTDPRVALYFPSFVIGLALGRQGTVPPLMPAAAAVLGLASVILTLGLPIPRIEFALSASPMATFLALALITTALRFGDHVRPTPLLTALGSASFFSYLLHRLVYKPLAAAFPSGDPALRIPFLVCVALPLVLAIGWAGQKAYDALLRRLHLS